VKKIGFSPERLFRVPEKTLIESSSLPVGRELKVRGSPAFEHVIPNEKVIDGVSQKGLLFDCLTTVSVMLERSESSQGGVDFDFDAFLHSGHR
jgi:hypothetical protein